MKGWSSYQTFSVLYLLFLIGIFYFVGGILVDYLGYAQITWMRASNVNGLILCLGGFLATKYIDRRLARMLKEPPKKVTQGAQEGATST